MEPRVGGDEPERNAHRADRAGDAAVEPERRVARFVAERRWPLGLVPHAFSFLRIGALAAGEIRCSGRAQTRSPFNLRAGTARVRALRHDGAELARGVHRSRGSLGGSDMPIGTILLIVLLLLVLGSWPAWPYSRSWGYGPSGIVGAVVVVLVILLLLGRL